MSVQMSKQDTHPGDGTPYFLVEYKVLAATEGSENKVGDIVSHMIMLRGNQQQKDKAMGEIKAAVAAILGAKPELVTQEVCEVFVGEKQPAKGKQVRISARNKITKAKKDFTVISYTNPAL